ncbi:uncharacterized protein LOC125500402 [Athalia rosae]|uniref:uncharacterized protein LOC125500402 n=1 Tax=Athalia rosae TaxID=37344 RepID=UPI00203483CE|nr:uncharacterized protein LOC125500402 [Athalia rosae]XP_048509296.1 uncharacterized protein LOC125500402 [Athalia rosae]
MNSPIAILVVLAIFAQSHFGHCGRYGGQNTNSKNQRPLGQSGESNYDTTSNPDGDNSDFGKTPKNTSKFCAIKKSEKITLDGVLVGLSAMFSTPIRLLKKYGPNGGSPNTMEDETAIQQSENKALVYFSKAAEAGFSILQRLRPEYEDLIRSIRNRAFPMFYNGSAGINYATRLVYRKNPEEVQTEIDAIQPETVASFVNGIAQYYIAMREATPGQPVILTTNEQPEERSLINIMKMFRGVFSAISYMLDSLVNTGRSGNTRQYLSEVQKIQEKSFSAAKAHVKVLYNEIRRWANVQVGCEESCDESVESRW